MYKPSLFPSHDRPAAVSIFLYFCAGCADGLVVPFFPLWAQNDAGISPALIGTLFACYAGGEIVAAPFIGGIADRVGRRPVLILSSFGVACGFMSLSLASGPAAAAVILILTGLCECVLHPTIGTVIADVTQPEDHRRLFSLARVGANAGRVLGPAMGAFVALYSLRAVFLVGAIVLVLGAVVAIGFLPETLVAGEHDVEEESLSALLPAFRDRRLASILFWVLLIEIASSWIETVVPLYAHAAGTLTPSGVGLLFAYSAALVVFAQMSVSRFTARSSAMSLTFGAGAALVGGFGMLLASPGVVSLVGAVSLYSFGQMLIDPLVPTAINQLASARNRASYMAAASVASDLKDSLGPASGTAFYALAGTLPWVLGIPLALAGSLGLGIAIARQQEDATQTGSS